MQEEKALIAEEEKKAQGGGEEEGDEGQRSFFSEKPQVLAAISVICHGGGGGGGGGGCADDEPTFDADAFQAKFEWLSLTLGKYQEQPALLASSLEEMVTPLATKMLSLVTTKHGQSVPGGVHLDAICKVLQLICRVRGFKHVIKLFPHEVSHLETCLFLIQHQSTLGCATWETHFVLLLWLCILCLIPFDICSMDSTLSSTTRTSDAVGASGQESKSTLVQQIVELSRTFLSDTGPTREAASACLSALLTRPDMETGLLSSFVDWTCDMIQAWVHKGEMAREELTPDSFQIIGVLHCISQIFKKGHRSRLLPHAARVLGPCLQIAAQNNQTMTRKLTCKLAQRIGTTFVPPRVAAWRYQRGQRSLLQNLQLPQLGGGGEAKLEGGETPLPHPAAEGSGATVDDELAEEEAPQELEEIIDHLLSSLQDKDTVVRWSAAKGVGRITMRLSKNLADDVVGAVLDSFSDPEADSSWHGGCLALAELTRRGLLLPDRLAEVVPLIRRAIHFDVLRGQHSVGAHVRDAACYVCWAFARAYSPLVMRPFIQELASAMLVTALYDREINCRRAASAAFQENVGRQGNENFPFGISIITVADYYSLGKRSSAFLHIAPTVAGLSDHFHEVLTNHLMNKSICHWDEDVRLLASKALACLTKMNPLRAMECLERSLEASLSSNFATRHGALLTVSEVIMSLSSCSAEFRPEVVEKTANLVLSIDKARLFRGRGGELLRQASCKLIENIARAHFSASIKTKVSLVEFLNENLRQPHEFIQRSARLALRQVYFSYFSSGSEEPSERLQKLSVKKYTEGLMFEENVAVTRGYALALGILPIKLLCQPEGRLEEVLGCLAASSNPEKLIAGEADAETRRNAIESTAELIERLSGSPYFKQCHVEACFSIFFKACTDHSIDKRGDTGSWSRIAALQGLERLVYACQRVSSKGSIAGYVMTSYGAGQIANGDKEESCSFVRVQFPVSSLGYSVASSESTEDNFSHVGCLSLHKDSVRDLAEAVISEQEREAISLGEHVISRVVGAMLEQLAEKLDAVREVSGNCLQRMLTDSLHVEAVPHIPDRPLLMTALLRAASLSMGGGRDEAIRINWAHPAHVFPFLSEVMNSEHYFDSIVAGIVIAVGGLSETVVRESTAALTNFCRSKSSDRAALKALATSLLNLFALHSKCDRVILPLLKTIYVLLQNGIFDFCTRNDTFPSQLLEAVQEEAKSGNNVIKIKLCIDVLTLLLLFEDPVRHSALKNLVIFLGHKFPRVRKHAAEHLYLQFLSDAHALGPTSEDVLAMAQQEEEGSNERKFFSGFTTNCEDLEKAQDVLAVSCWDGKLEEARAKRMELCTLLGLKMQTRAVDPSASTRVVVEKEDELNSYASLVREAGY